MSTLIPRLRTVIVALMMTTCLPKGITECITNPMDKINQQAHDQYQTTGDVLEAIEKSTPIVYKNLLRIYGIYRSCIEGGTGRWTDNQGSKGCPYCRSSIEEVDKTVNVRRERPSVQNSTSCAKDKFCHESPHGCFYYGPQASEEECGRLGPDWDGRDGIRCHGNRHYTFGYNCNACTIEKGYVKTDGCPIMCGLCRPPCENIFCKNFGLLDHDSCTCTCHEKTVAYTGEYCDQLNCSLLTEDIRFCSNKDKKECGDEFPVVVCPYLCGICPTQT